MRRPGTPVTARPAHRGCVVPPLFLGQGAFWARGWSRLHTTTYHQVAGTGWARATTGSRNAAVQEEEREKPAQRRRRQQRQRRRPREELTSPYPLVNVRRLDFPLAIFFTKVTTRNFREGVRDRKTQISHLSEQGLDKILFLNFLPVEKLEQKCIFAQRSCFSANF